MDGKGDKEKEDDGCIYETPEYLQHKVYVLEAAARQAVKAAALWRGEPVARRLQQDERRRDAVKRWKVKSPDLDAWRRASLDQRSIYQLREDTLIIEDDGKRSLTAPNIEKKLPEVDFQQYREKTYIEDSAVKNPEKHMKKKFAKAVMQVYNTPLRTKTPSYRAPRDHLKPKEQGKPSIFKPKHKPNEGIPIYANQKEPVPSNHVTNTPRDLFCETLGPSVCGCCIECTNRKIAREVEQQSFPELDCSSTTLVAPKLAMIMMDFDRLHAEDSPGAGGSQTERTLISRDSSVLLPPVGGGDRHQYARSVKTRSSVRRGRQQRPTPAITEENHHTDNADSGYLVSESEDELASSTSSSQYLTNKHPAYRNGLTVFEMLLTQGRKNSNTVARGSTTARRSTIAQGSSTASRGYEDLQTAWMEPRNGRLNRSMPNLTLPPKRGVHARP